MSKNADRPCPYWMQCNDSGPCIVHADCERCCDAGYTYVFELGELADFGADDDLEWEKHKVVCECVAEVTKPGALDE